METQLFTVLLLCAAVVAGDIYHFTPVNLDTPENSVCPPNSQLEAARNNIASNVSEILLEIAANIITNNTYTIPACGGSGWRQVAYFNMTDPAQNCPEQWMLIEQDALRACGRQESGQASCDSLLLPYDGDNYTEVCGKIRGYQYYTPDGGFIAYIALTSGNEINEPYLDGVSITHGSPREHIWSLYGAVNEEYCCSESLKAHWRTYFVGNHYFCDTSNPQNQNNWMFFTDHILWDGSAQCPSNSTCCAPHLGPWFHSVLNRPSANDIEVRICGDESTANENTPLELIEIYVK